MTRITGRFCDRIRNAAKEKQSPIVVALDLRVAGNLSYPASAYAEALEQAAVKIVNQIQASICAVKINFHLLLPLSAPQVLKLNKLIHSHGLLSIADIKLNDIEQTNEVVLENLVSRMGFDCVIANPFIGSMALSSLVRKAHGDNAGVIALVYMSHPEAVEGYGLRIALDNGEKPLYEIFLERAFAAEADGIVIGATQKDILARVMAGGKAHPPIFSPGIGAQGANVEDAVKSGCDFLIIGRSIVEAKDPRAAAQQMQSRAAAAMAPNSAS